jgi:hypothetical protein
MCSVLALGVSLGQCCNLHQFPFIVSPHVVEHGPAAAVVKQKKKKCESEEIFIYVYIHFEPCHTSEL